MSDNFKKQFNRELPRDPNLLWLLITGEAMTKRSESGPLARTWLPTGKRRQSENSKIKNNEIKNSEIKNSEIKNKTT